MGPETGRDTVGASRTRGAELDDAEEVVKGKVPDGLEGKLHARILKKTACEGEVDGAVAEDVGPVVGEDVGNGGGVDVVHVAVGG